jgi:hypothetical protein
MPPVILERFDENFLVVVIIGECACELGLDSRCHRGLARQHNAAGVVRLQPERSGGLHFSCLSDAAARLQVVSFRRRFG